MKNPYLKKSSSENPANLSVSHQHKDHQHHMHMQKKPRHELNDSFHIRRQQVISKTCCDKNDENKPKVTNFSSPGELLNKNKLNHANNFQQKTSNIASDLSSAPTNTSSNNYSTTASLMSTNLTQIRKLAGAHNKRMLGVQNNRTVIAPSNKGNPMHDKKRNTINYLQQSKVSRPTSSSTTIPKTNNMKIGKISDNIEPNKKNKSREGIIKVDNFDDGIDWNAAFSSVEKTYSYSNEIKNRNNLLQATISKAPKTNSPCHPKQYKNDLINQSTRHVNKLHNEHIEYNKIQSTSNKATKGFTITSDEIQLKEQNIHKKRMESMIFSTQNKDRYVHSSKSSKRAKNVDMNTEAYHTTSNCIADSNHIVFSSTNQSRNENETFYQKAINLPVIENVSRDCEHQIKTKETIKLNGEKMHSAYKEEKIFTVQHISKAKCFNRQPNTDDLFDNGIDWSAIEINASNIRKPKRNDNICESRESFKTNALNPNDDRESKKKDASEIKSAPSLVSNGVEILGQNQIANTFNTAIKKNSSIAPSSDEKHLSSTILTGSGNIYPKKQPLISSSLNNHCTSCNIFEQSLSSTSTFQTHKKTEDTNLESAATIDHKRKNDAKCEKKESNESSPTYERAKKTSMQASGDFTGSSSLSTIQERNSPNFIFSKSTLPRKSSHLPPLPSDIDYDKKRLLPVEDGYRRILIENSNLSKPLLNGWELHPHQKIAVIKALKLRRIILAYDMGLGKTLIACVWAKAFKKTFESLRILVIAPVSLRNEWEKTALNATGLRVAPEKISKKDKNDESYDMFIYSWGKVPTEIPSTVHSFIVICDEAHQMQSMNATRTKGILNLTVEKRCIGCILQTGTPMKNGKPKNLFPLLKAINHPFGDRQKIYETIFCAGREKRFGPNKVVWDANGCSNLPILNAHISSHMLHMTKEDCMKNIPPKTRVVHKVAVSRHFEIMYTNKINDLAKLKQSCAELNNKDMGEALLGLLQKVRFAASIAKVDAAVALALEILEKQPAIVIFTSFVNVAKDLHRKLEESGWTGELLTGETPSAKRGTMVNNFQSGVSPVFISTFGAGGVGLTLTAAYTVILVDRPWTPGDAMQAEDRVRRIGQTKPVKCIWMRAFDVDEQIDRMIEQKNINSNQVIDGRKNLGTDAKNGSTNQQYSVGCRLDGKDAPSLSIMQLVRSLVPPEKPDASFKGLNQVKKFCSNFNESHRKSVDEEGGGYTTEQTHT